MEHTLFGRYNRCTPKLDVLPDFDPGKGFQGATQNESLTVANWGPEAKISQDALRRRGGANCMRSLHDTTEK